MTHACLSQVEQVKPNRSIQFIFVDLTCLICQDLQMHLYVDV